MAGLQSIAAVGASPESTQYISRPETVNNASFRFGGETQMTQPD
jgi:hypothetical protein